MNIKPPGPWIIYAYHTEDRPARMVARDGGKGWPECLTTSGHVTLGGAGRDYCFISEVAARAAIAIYADSLTQEVK